MLLGRCLGLPLAWLASSCGGIVTADGTPAPGANSQPENARVGVDPTGPGGSGQAASPPTNRGDCEGNCEGQSSSLGGAGPATPVDEQGGASGETVAIVAADGRGTCFRDEAGLYCWGNNRNGQLGNGSMEPHAVPTRVHGSLDPDRLAVGYSFTCAIERGSLWCWGINQWGNLGMGELQDPETGAGGYDCLTTPGQVGSEMSWQRVDMGLLHTCGIASGALFCWGYNRQGQLGQGNSGWGVHDTPLSVGAFTDWQTLGLGRHHTCAIRQQALYCWGWSDSGQTGVGTTTDVEQPTRVGTDSDWDGVAGGESHTCGIRSGALYCWGANEEGALGLGDYDDRDRPARVGTSTDWDSVAAGARHTCGIRDGRLFCWGANAAGQLGVGDVESRALPAQVGPRQDWEAVALGFNHTCAIRARAPLCWGDNSDGQLGIGSFDEEPHPEPILVELH